MSNSTLYKTSYSTLHSSNGRCIQTSGVVTAGVDGTYSAVERAVTRAHSTVSLYDVYEAIDDDAAVFGHRHCSIYTYNWIAVGWAGNGDGGGVSKATTTSLSLAIVAGRNNVTAQMLWP
jgi:hypothetical protein